MHSIHVYVCMSATIGTCVSPPNSVVLDVCQDSVQFVPLLLKDCGSKIGLLSLCVAGNGNQYSFFYLDGSCDEFITYSMGFFFILLKESVMESVTLVNTVSIIYPRSGWNVETYLCTLIIMGKCSITILAQV